VDGGQLVPRGGGPRCALLGTVVVTGEPGKAWDAPPDELSGCRPSGRIPCSSAPWCSCSGS